MENISKSYDLFAASALCAFAWVTKNLPVRVVYFGATLIGSLTCCFHKKGRKRIEHNLDIVYPDGPPFDRKKFARKVYVNMFKFMLEFFLAQRKLRRGNWQDYVSGPGVDLMLKERESINKGIFVSGHFGSMLLLSHAITQVGYPITVVVQIKGGPRIQRVWKSLFNWSGQNAVLKRSAYEELKKVADRGGFPTVAMDQHGGRKSLHVDFLGQKAYTPAGPPALARRYRIPIYAGGLIRNGTFKFKLYVTKIDPIVTDDKQADLECMARQVNQVLGDLILKYPEQWFWMHRRWRYLDSVPKKSKPLFNTASTENLNVREGESQT